ncbi:MarR family winged helix-turn-helix transcriptional regulator [Gryllotalpicola ginsengisoli]|uniref:MarR family winged helix-turn-helix transcriptional regulator n=1 Tax=Gryllotalpicola ginsengisoli TaxID=444608 RepID=UPI0003B45B6F|nr:MarR family transcriptional regulator [Gryllotalpicola ginsengisoli]
MASTKNPKPKAARSELLGQIFEEISVITRRSTARARRLAAPLTFVEHSLLQFIGSTPGCRATDIAASFHLNRSTVSRQVAGLFELGLVEYAPHTEDVRQRGRELRLTEHGKAQLNAAQEAQRTAMFDRLADWSDAEVAEFAELLARYNKNEPEVR